MKPLPLSFLPEAPDEEKGLAKKCIIYSVAYRLLLPVFYLFMIESSMFVATVLGWIPFLGWYLGFIGTIVAFLCTIYLVLGIVLGIVAGCAFGCFSYYTVWNGERMPDDPHTQKMTKILTVVTCLIPYGNMFPELGGFLYLLYVRSKMQK